MSSWWDLARLAVRRQSFWAAADYGSRYWKRIRIPNYYKRLCSHSIRASALPTIERLGLDRRFDELHAVRHYERGWTNYGGWFREEIGGDVHGYNIQRKTLDPLMRSTAAAVVGVELMLGAKVRELTRDAGGRIDGVDGRRRRSAAAAGGAPGGGCGRPHVQGRGDGGSSGAGVARYEIRVLRRLPRCRAAGRLDGCGVVHRTRCRIRILQRRRRHRACRHAEQSAARRVPRRPRSGTVADVRSECPMARTCHGRNGFRM